MEPSVASTNPTVGNSALTSLPIDIWEHILSYDVSNVCLYLFLTGSKPLITRMCYMSQLSLHWTSWRFVNWSEASFTLSLLPRLKSLELSTWSSQIKTLGPVNAGIFPSTLRRLALRFHGASALLSVSHASTLLQHLVVLDTLTVHEESCSYVESLSLMHFPPSLRCLHIQSSDDFTESSVLQADWKDLLHLPEGLETLRLHCTLNKLETSLKWPSTLPLVTDLSIRLERYQSIAFDGIEAQLKRLEFFGRRIRLSGQRVISPSTMPALEVLRTNAIEFTSWTQLQDLPPTLTNLAVRFNAQLEVPASQDPILYALNTHPLSRAFAVPRNLRRLEKWDDSPFSQDFYPSLLTYFPSLSVDSFKHYEALRLVDLHNKQPSDVTIGQLNSLQCLPSTLTALHVKSLTLEAGRNLNLPFTQPLPAILSISLLEVGSFVSSDLIPLLPHSLETLRIAVFGSGVLVALVQHPRLVHLKNLTLSLASTETWSLDCNTIPSSLTSLKVKYGNTNIVYVLDDHPNLTRLDLTESYFVPSFMPKLPCNLRSLSIHLHKRFNLAYPLQATYLFNMSTRFPHLKELHITSVFGKETKTNGWLEVLSLTNLPPTSSATSNSLPLPVKQFYAQCNKVRGKEADRTLSTSSELFILSCLPRNLSLLSLPPTMLTRSLEVDYRLELLYSTLKYQFPLLWLPYACFERPYPTQRVAQVLPPQLSLARVDDVGSERDIDRILSRNASGSVRHAWSMTSNWWFHEIIHRIMDAILLVTVARNHSVAQSYSVVRYFLYANAFASALTVPRLSYRLYSSGLLRSQAPSAIGIGALTAMLFVFCVTVLPNALLFSLVGSSASEAPYVGLAVAFFCLVRNFYFQHVYV